MLPESFKHYELGLPELDKSHWELFEMLNRMTYTLSHSEMIELATRLNQMWIEHDREEEKLMQELDFPYFKAHKESHKVMAAEFLKFKSKFENDIKYTNDSFKNDLETMTKNHIDRMDSQYAVWAKKMNYQK